MAPALFALTWNAKDTWKTLSRDGTGGWGSLVPAWQRNIKSMIVSPSSRYITFAATQFYNNSTPMIHILQGYKAHTRNQCNRSNHGPPYFEPCFSRLLITKNAMET